MRLWIHEARVLLRARSAATALLLLALLSIAAVAAGMTEMAHQRAAIAAIPAAQAEDIGAISAWVDAKKDPGSAAYYSFHPTWDAPAPLAFAAIGMRDVVPYILRVRALGLEAQIHDSDNFNPELALPGRFDLAFVIVFLLPLFVIALFHDHISGEREAGRLRMLAALAGGTATLGHRRTALRFGLLFAAVAIPFIVGATLSGVAAGVTMLVLLLIAAYATFWIGLAALIGRAGWSSATNAASLVAIWLVLVLVLPALAHVVINRAVPVGQGAAIARDQREAVNRAWDIPREETMRRFYASHPVWRGSPPLPPTFHYKWYFAFHQVGDESVAPRLAAYRAGLERRVALGNALGWLLPSVGVQAALSRLAETDLTAHLAYQDRIRAYHRQLRNFYYGYIFNDRPFGKGDFGMAPMFAEGGTSR